MSNTNSSDWGEPERASLRVKSAYSDSEGSMIKTLIFAGIPIHYDNDITKIELQPASPPSMLLATTNFGAASTTRFPFREDMACYNSHNVIFKVHFFVCIM